MSKIVSAVNAMISCQERIDSVLIGNNSNEIFFRFDKKYIWSIMKDSNQDIYFLHFYPRNDIMIEDLASIFNWESISMVTYSTKELGTKEAVASFAELYTILKEKVHGIDAVLDDIIASDIPF